MKPLTVPTCTLLRPAVVLITALCTVGAAWASCAPASAAVSAPTLNPAAIDDHVRDYMAQTKLPGAVVVVTKDDHVVHTAGYGHAATGRTLTAQTRVPVASLSKSMTALAVMQLVEAGKVDLDQPVRRYLPEFTMADRRAERITVRQLLNQSSGMADSGYPDLARPQPRTLREAVAKMREGHLADEPGTQHNYHNPNYFVAARLVEVVSGQPFADYLSAKLFKPLHMTHTTSVDTTDDMPGRARGYVRAYGKVLALPHPRWFAAGGHGVVTTADDLAQWLIAQNNQGVAADGRRIASARSVSLTQTPPKTPRDSGYAMGWRQDTQDGEPKRLQHTGSLLTHNSIATLLPDRGIGIAVVANTGMISGDDAAHISEGLVELARGRNPQVTEPFSMSADRFLAVITLLTLALGVSGVLRARRWASRTAHQPWWRLALRLQPFTLPVLLITQLAPFFGLLMNRAGTLAQVGYVWPALVICSATAALVSITVIAARGHAALRLRRRA